MQTPIISFALAVFNYRFTVYNATLHSHYTPREDLFGLFGIYSALRVGGGMGGAQLAGRPIKTTL